MSEENEEHKRSPLIPRIIGARESGIIQVPFEIYEQYCRNCSDCLKTFTPHDKYVEQLTKFMDEREPMKIKCSAINRCVHLQKLVDEWKQEHGYV